MEANGALATLPGDPLDVLDSWYTALGILKDLRGRVAALEDEAVWLRRNQGGIEGRLEEQASLTAELLSWREVLVKWTQGIGTEIESWGRRADDFDQKIGVLRAKVREIPAAEETEKLWSVLDGIKESLEIQELAVDALAGRLGRLEHAVETEGLGAVLRRLEAIEEAVEGLRAGEGRRVRRHRKSVTLPEREEDLDGEDLLTLGSWTALEGPLAELVRQAGTKGAGNRLTGAYRALEVDYQARKDSSNHFLYPVADLRAYGRWLATTRRRSLESWLAYFEQHCLPVWAERSLRLKEATA